MRSVAGNPDHSELTAFLRLQDRWGEAVEQLQALVESRRDHVRAQEAYRDVYAGERAAMVFDVVASRQRPYQTVVRSRIATFQEQWPGLPLHGLVEGGPTEGFGLPVARWATITGVAAGLERYRHDTGLAEAPDDKVVAHWAAATEPARLTPGLDPYVGAVSGIGVALFAYLRMRSGADALKPDVRVRRRLRGLGFRTPTDDAALLLMAEVAAAEVGLGRFELDQLLW